MTTRIGSAAKRRDGSGHKTLQISEAAWRTFGLPDELRPKIETAIAKYIAFERQKNFERRPSTLRKSLNDAARLAKGLHRKLTALPDVIDAMVPPPSTRVPGSSRRIPY